MKITQSFFAAVMVLSCLAVGPHALGAQAQTVALASTSTTATSPATTPWMAVEVLVFRSIDANAGHAESWPAKVPAPSTANAVYPTTASTAEFVRAAATSGLPTAVAAAMPASSTPAYAALTHHGPLIDMAQNRLRDSSQYEVVKILGWQQPADASQPVSFTPPPASSVKVPKVGTVAFALPAPATFTLTQSRQPIEPVATVQVQGTARLLISGALSYVVLHLRLCQPAPPGIMVWTPPVATVATATPATALTPILGSQPSALPAAVPERQCFVLNQRHPVKAGTLSYYDNPMFGALVSVRAIAPPTTAPAKQKSNQPPQ